MTGNREAPAATAQMMIRKPIEIVFESLIEPGITSRFWFSKGSGRSNGWKANSLGLGNVRTSHGSRCQSVRNK